MATKHRVFIGIDNGVTGTIGFVSTSGEMGMYYVPTKECLNYQKKGQIVTRIDVDALRSMLHEIVFSVLRSLSPSDKPEVIEAHVILERPFTMGSASKAVLSGQRAMEAVLITLELEGFPYEFIDSKQWQKPMLGTELKGSDRLKKASLAKAKQIWPLFDWIPFRKDADGLLIAEWAKTRVPF